jgi:protein-S-isoprenylcysteine O-methyltransferase Ste14
VGGGVDEMGGSTMLTGLFQSVVLLATGIVYYSVDFWLIERHDRLRHEEGSGRSWGYTAAMISILALLAAQPTFLPALGIKIGPPWGIAIQAIGIILLTIAFPLHWWARAHLRQFYAEDVVFQAGHRLVDTGPYRHVRHPVFTSFLIIALGLLLVNPALPTLLLTLYAFWDFPRAAKQEEGLLCENLEGYAEYMERTGRFLPSLRGRK